MVPEGGRKQAVFPHLKNCSLLSFRVKLHPPEGFWFVPCPNPPSLSASSPVIIPCAQSSDSASARARARAGSVIACLPFAVLQCSPNSHRPNQTGDLFNLGLVI